MMRAGALRHEITIQQQSTDRDTYGEQVHTWTTYLTARAAIDWSPGREALESAHRNVKVPTVFRIRHRTGVTAAMRVLHDSRLFNILSAVDPDGRKEQLVLTAEELVGET